MSAPVRDEKWFQQFVGTKIPPSIYRIRGKALVEYAKAIGDLNPKYYKEVAEGEEVTGVVAHPAYAATYTIPGLFSLADLKSSDDQPFITNVGKLLHTGQDYDFTGCVPLVPPEKIYTSGVITKIWIKSEILWIETKLESRNKEGDKLFCKTTCTAGIRKGGY
jgi:hypothetical protein